MPRVQPTKEAAILKYFDETPLEIAAVILNLATSKVRARQAEKALAKARGLQGAKKAAELRQKATTPKPTGLAPHKPAAAKAVAKPAAASAKKSHKKGAGKKPPADLATIDSIGGGEYDNGSDE